MLRWKQMAPMMLVAASLTSGIAKANSADLMLTAEQVTSDVALAQEAFERIHPGYTRYAEAATLKAAWAGLARKAQEQQGMRVGEFYIELQKVLTLIRCDHTKAELPEALKDERDVIPVYLPFRWTLIEDRAIISIPGHSGLARGEEIISIDGRPISEMIAEVRPLIPTDGFAEWAKRGGISESLEFAGGAIDHFGALLWDIKPQAELEIADARGARRNVRLDRMTFQAWTGLPEQAGEVEARSFSKAVTFEPLGEKAGYLRIDSFINYRDIVEPAKIYDPIFDRMATEGRDRLILDLRKNGGGSTDAKNALIARLIGEKLTPMDDAYMITLDHKGIENHLWTWDKRAINPSPLGFTKNSDGNYSLRPMFEDNLQMIEPAKNAFHGKLIVLTSDENSSGSATFLGLMQRSDRATLVGEKTGGSPDGATAGVIFFLTLPASKIRMRVPAIRYYADMGEGFTAGSGVAPDIETERTVADFRLGRDPALERAKQLVGVLE